MNSKFKIGHLLLIVLSAISLSCSQKVQEVEIKPPADPCLQNKVAFDIGSGETRMQVAEVNICKNLIVLTLLTVKEKVSYKEDLVKSTNGNFSTEIQTQGLETLRKMKMQAEQFKPQTYVGAATAAFRDAKNAQTFIELVNRELAINAKIITAKEEAIIGYYSAVGATNLNPDQIIVWDVGGSSQQIIYDKGHSKYETYEGKIGSVTYKDKVLKKIKQTNKLSPNPLNKNQMNAAVKLAMNLASQTVQGPVKREFKKNKRKVIGIGGVHYYALLKQIKPNSDSNILTRNEIEAKLNELVGKTDEDLKNEKHVETMITNVALIFGFMKALEITQVEIYNVDLTQGLLIYPTYPELKKAL